jgi:hypothetical protein
MELKLSALSRKTAPPEEMFDTWKRVVGFAVPTPTLPAFVTTKFVPVEDPIANAGAVPFAEVGLIENCAQGEVVPIPTKPMLLIENRVVVPAPLLDEAMLKRTRGLEKAVVVVETKIERPPYGVEVPMPTLPPYCARSVVEATLRVVKYAVLEAMSPAWSQSGVVVALTAVLKLVVGVNHVPTPSPDAVMAPQMMLPEASVVRALAVLQAPKRPMVVEPMFEIEKSV